jgi:hypothetical protein
MVNETFRPRSNFAWAITSYILIALFVINSFWVVSDNIQIIRDLVIGTILGFLVYIFWIRPKLVLKADFIQVINPLRTVLIAYNDVLDLETKWSLAIVHSRGKTRVWVAPATGKQRWIAEKKFGWYGGGLPLSQSSSTGTESMSASLDSVSGQAAFLIRERIKRNH